MSQRPDGPPDPHDRAPATCRPEGVFYVATEKDSFVAEAAASVRSLRAFWPEAHVTLFTDRPRAVAVHEGLFDAVEELPFAEGLGTSWGSGLLGKVRAFVRAPYVKALFLDTDTRVLQARIRELFERLDEYEIALAVCEPGESRNQILSRRPMYNSGVIAFRRTEPVERLLAAWLERQEAHALSIRRDRMDTFEYVRHIQGWDKLYQLVADQTALAQFLAPDVNVFGLRCLSLERVWNWRPDDIDAAHVNDVVVHHAQKFKVDPL